MRYTGPKARQCRRENTNLFGSPKYQKILARNQNIPGMHGAKRQGKISEFGKQLREKQKAKRMFCLSEKQFYKYFQRATAQKGVTGENLLRNLETRLDNVLYRGGLAITRMQARQFVSHGLFQLNGKSINVPSAVVRVGDKVTIKPSKSGLKIFKNMPEDFETALDVPGWLKSDFKSRSIEVVSMPEMGHFEAIIDPQPIVEFYSR